jgi:hypothetical protein
MELLSVIRARAIWLIYIRELNPRGKNINVNLVEWLKNKYFFLKYPSSVYERSETGSLIFTDGTFRSHDGSYISVDLNVYNDGFVVDTRSSTRDSDLFIEDAIYSLVNDFGLVYKPEMVRKRLYVSELHVRSERSLNSINPRMQAFIHKIQSMMDTQESGVLELATLGFLWDFALPNGQSNFQFERVVDIPFSERRYFSRAPLHTEDHLSLLNDFEDLLVP